jgi:undecaprenol kinase
MPNKFKYALNGIERCATGSTFRTMLYFAASAVVALYLRGITETEWVVVALLIGLTLSAEMMNTALEMACDLFSQGWLLDEIRDVKDVAAGGVLLLSLVDVVVGLIIFF